MSSPPSYVPNNRIPCLDGLRAIAIILVLVGHGLSTIPIATQLGSALPYLGNASLGVLTFFVISGYLITHLLRKEWERTGTIQLGAFYARRALRIFPAFYAYLLTVLVLRLVGLVDTTYFDIASAGTFLSNYKHCLLIPSNEDYWFVGHFWTLSLEEQFYLFWPATILAIGLVRSPRVAFVMVLVAPVVRVITYFTWPASRGQLGMMLHTAADPLMFGCLAALWQGHTTFEKLLNRFSSWVWPLSAMLFLIFPSAWLAARYLGGYTMTVGMSLNGLAVTFVMLWVVRNPSCLVGRLLQSPIMVRIGVLSYSLYLWQQLFLTPLNSSFVGTFPVNFVACFVAAELSYRVIEAPFLRFRSRFRGQKSDKERSDASAK